MTREQKQEYTLRISQANKTELIVILYEMALIYMEESREANSMGDRENFRAAIRRTRGCVNELMASLHFEYEIAMNLLQLYLYINRELAKAEVKGSAEFVQNAEKVISGLLSAYREISKQDTSAPVMENTQSIYTGFTYDKTQLLDSLSNHGGSRGFSV